MKPFFSRKSNNEGNFLEIINANFDKLDSDTKESCIVGDFKT